MSKHAENERMANRISPDEPWATEQSIKARLTYYKLIDKIDDVPPDIFCLVAGKLRDFKQRPITDEDMAKMKELGGEQADARAALNRAAQILYNEIDQRKWRSYPEFKEYLRRWEEAIVVLKMPRGAVDNRNDWLDGAKSGHHVRAWSYMATEIAGYTLQALRSYREQDVSLRHDSNFIKFIREVLEFVGVNKPPSCSTISKVLGKNLPKTNALRKRTRNPSQNTGADPLKAQKVR